jgi:hypothetical protein
MAEYKSESHQINAAAASIYHKLSNLENLRTLLESVPDDKIPEDKRAQLKSLQITEDSISMAGGPTGSITLKIAKKVEPQLIVLKAADLPLDLCLEIRIKEAGDNLSELHTAIVADIPMMLRAMVKGPFNQIVTQFADMLSAIPYEA